MHYGAHGRDVIADVGGPDPPEHLVDRVSVGEDVVRRIPVGVLVGIAEAGHPQRRSVSEGSSQVSRSCACADRRLQRINDLRWIVSEQLSRERRMVRPPTQGARGSEQFRHLAG